MLGMIDHMGIDVSDLERSRDFYKSVLATLGIPLTKDEDSWVLFGRDAEGGFVIGSDKPATTPIHVAFTAKTRAQVDMFYKVALKGGGRDNGAPGIRAIYGPNYYAAFILDPDGHNIEAVCHAPQ